MREWEDYIQEEERVAYETCVGHRKSKGLPCEEDGIDVLDLECANEPCRFGCPFEPKEKEEKSE